LAGTNKLCDRQNDKYLPRQDRVDPELMNDYSPTPAQSPKRGFNRAIDGSPIVANSRSAQHLHSRRQTTDLIRFRGGGRDPDQETNVVTHSLTWLHLSDLHAGKPGTAWDARRVVDTISSDLKRLAADHGLRPDLLFFTGDLAFGEGPSSGGRLADQFDVAEGILDKVRSCFQPSLPKSHTFIVPGNHDVDRGAATPEQQLWLDRLDDPAPVIAMIREGGRQWERFAERLAAYREFLRRAGYLHLLQDPTRLTYSHIAHLNGLRVGIAGFNSAWSCHRESEKGKLWVGGRWQAEELYRQLIDADLRVALVHHPQGWYVDHEANDFWRRSIQKYFQFALHGHEHDVWVDVLGRKHVTIAAAACYVRSDKRPGYNLVRLDLVKGSGEVWLRTYDNRGGGWIADLVYDGTDSRGVWPLTVPEGTAARLQSLANTSGHQQTDAPPPLQSQLSLPRSAATSTAITSIAPVGNVPLPAQRMIGREGLLDDIAGLLTRFAARSSQDAYNVVSIQGMPGLGKTSLAVAAAHRSDVKQAFASIVWQPMGKRADPLAILSRWCHQLNASHLLKRSNERRTLDSSSAAVALGE
jgi:hypothetical protein